jgi:hypothetical protein
MDRERDATAGRALSDDTSVRVNLAWEYCIMNREMAKSKEIEREQLK